jgi:hypothetical protein
MAAKPHTRVRATLLWSACPMAACRCLANARLQLRNGKVVHAHGVISSFEIARKLDGHPCSRDE